MLEFALLNPATTILVGVGVGIGIDWAFVRYRSDTDPD